MPYARAAFYKSYTTVVHGRMEGCRQAGGLEAALDFGLSSSCILQDLQVGGGGL